jgi:hypothetical protein
MSWLAIFIALFIQQSTGASALQVSPPAKITEIDAGKLKGEPTQLAWSPDGAKLFLQTNERDTRGMVTKPRYYVMSAGDGKPESVSAPPDWVGDYWIWKSGKAAPGASTFAIDIKDEQRATTATASPMGGALARGDPSGDPAGGSSLEDATSRAQQTQKQHVITLTLRGQTVGEFVNQQFLPGYTFGWSPQALGLIAYGSSSGRLTLMDAQGRRQEVEATKNVILPAWSVDGGKIAFFQKTAKNKYDLCTVDVKQP